MSGSQLGTATSGARSAPGTYLVTVHGIGPYDPRNPASGRLVGTLDSDRRAGLTAVDFDWNALVEERNFKDKVAQLSRSILEAAHLGTDEQFEIGGHLVSGAGFVLETTFKLALLAVPAFALVMVCAIPIYVRFGSFGVAGAATSFALSCMVLLWAATAAIFTAGLILAVLLRVIGLRVLAGALLRRMLLVPLQPVIPLAYRLGETETRDTLRNIAFFAVGYGLLTEGIKWWSSDAAAQWSGLGFRNLSLGAAALAVIIIIGQWISKVIVVPLKLARDIFNYIGDAEQRSSIQEKLTGALKNIPENAHIILAGHSLGSVIALDSLCNSNVWARFDSVSFVTCGSPVFRFFQRFFPGLFFPRDAADCCSRIQSRSRVVRWLNVYRAGLRGDPVGQALFRHGGTGTDLPIKQKERILMQAHVDYWDDPVVIEAVNGAWANVLPPQPAAQERASAPPEWHDWLFDSAGDLARTALALFTFLGFVFGVMNAFLIVQQRRSEAREFLTAAASKGIEVPAKVTHSTTTWGYGEDLSFPVQVYEFEFKDRGGAGRRLIFRENERSGFDGGFYFNSELLRKSFKREEYSKGKKSFDVQILYLEADPSHLTLADPAVRAKQSGFPVFEVLWTGIGASFWMMVIFLYGVHTASQRMVEALLPTSRA